MTTRRAFLGGCAAAAAAAQSPTSWRLGGSKKLTVRVRLAAPGTLTLGCDGEEPILRMEPAEGGGLAVFFRIDANPKPLALSIPSSGFQPTGTHEVVFRYAGPKADLFLDGVLVDEEWPSGSLPGSGEAHLRFDGRGILAADVSQGIDYEPPTQAQQSARADAILGPEKPVRQYWRPRGHNVSAGDAMPFFHAGRFHVYYLFDRRHHGSKWGLGAHQWAHISSTDLRNWDHHPIALGITAEEEGSICTGSVFYEDGLWYAFYATRVLDRSEHLALATSRDGIRFEKQVPSPLPEPAPPYRRGPNRDPFLFKRGPADYRLSVTAELENPDAARRGGALELLTSTDLRTWTQRPPLLVPGYRGQPECSDLFAWNGWYYLLFSPDGAPRYRMARSIDGPWAVPQQDLLGCPQAKVMKTAPFGANRRIGVAFLPDDGFGGDLVFRELVQLPDGRLGTRNVPELARPSQEVAVPRAELRIDSQGGFGFEAISPVPRDAVIRLKLRPMAGVLRYGLILRGAGKAEAGMELRFDPSQRKAEWRPVDAGSWQMNPQAVIEDVDGLDGEVSLEVTVCGDIFDVEINGVRTLMYRAPAQAGDRMFVWTQGAPLQATGIAVAELRS
jgi:beta-fructofuranosidase